MGWTYTRKEKGTSVKEFFENRWNSENIEILDVAVVKMRTAYMAIKNNQTNEVFGLVALLDYANKDYYNFGYKDMDESMHPYCYDCPKRILNLLTPTDNENAKAWRSECRKQLSEKKKVPTLKDGMIIRFENPLNFTDGRTLQEFQVVKFGRKVRFRNGGLYNISKWRERKFEVVQ